MSEPFIGQISIFGFNFAPVNWAFAAGQQMQISQFQALFALLGTTYGGDGRVSFALPDLQGRMPCGFGQSHTGGMSPPIGQVGGQAETTLNQISLPTHTHTAIFTPTGGGGPVTLEAAVDSGDSEVPATGSLLAAGDSGAATKAQIYRSSAGSKGTVALGGVSGGGGNGTVTVEPTGSGQPFSTVSPYLALNFSIALTGIFPSRN